MTLAQEFRDELITRHHLALDALDAQAQAIEAAEALAKKLSATGLSAYACGAIGESNRVGFLVIARGDPAVVLDRMMHLAIDTDPIGHYDRDHKGNPALDIYRVRVSGQEVILNVQPEVKP